MRPKIGWLTNTLNQLLIAEIMTSSDAALEKQLKKAISSTFGSAKEKIAGLASFQKEEIENIIKVSKKDVSNPKIMKLLKRA